MNFLAPLFLAGAVAIGLPILFHLIRRSVKERQVFSSLMFLSPSPPRLTRRSRLEHLLLLALRCAAILLLATAFARPFIRKPLPPEPTDETGRRVLVLVDVSASMQRPNLWAQASKKVEEIANSARPQDEMALFSFDRQLHPLCTFDDWNQINVGERAGLLRSRIASTKPGWSGTWLDNALSEAAELVNDNTAKAANRRQEIVLVTDLQEGSRLTGLQGYEWPKGLQVRVEWLRPEKPGNAGLQLLAGTEEQPGTTDLRVRLNNAADSKQEQFRLRLASATNGLAGVKPIEAYVPPGQSRVLTFPATNIDVIANSILVEGDETPFDNQIYFVPQQPVQHTVLYLGPDSDSDTTGPLFFLRNALQQSPAQKIRIVRAPTTGPLPDSDLKKATLIVCTGGASAQNAEQALAAVKEGKTLLLAATSSEALMPFATVFGGADFKAAEAKQDNYQMLGQIEFQHPLFLPFADPRYSDFTKIHFWKHRRFETNGLADARVLARFDSGDPAIFEIPSGKGRVFVFAFCWQPADSQLALSSKFVPLLYSLLELSGAQGPAPRQYTIGDVVSIPENPGGTQVQLPDGSAVQLAANETNFDRTATPGVYSAKGLSGSALQFVVNLDPNESRTAPLAADDLERLGVPMKKIQTESAWTAHNKVQLKNAELEGRQKLWRWVILCTLLVLGIETWLAGWTARQSLKEGATS